MIILAWIYKITIYKMKNFNKTTREIVDFFLSEVFLFKVQVFLPVVKNFSQ